MSDVMGTLRSGVPREIDFRLDQWARWARTAADQNGWPYATLLSRVIEFGPMGASQVGRPPIVIPEGVAEVDRILSKMPSHLREVLFEHYLTYAQLKDKAKKLRISASKFRYRLEVGQWYVCARLS